VNKPCDGFIALQ
jgi:hypothetical protein